TPRRVASRDLYGAAGRRGASEDFGGTTAAHFRVWLRRAQREGSAELRHHVAGAGVGQRQRRRPSDTWAKAAQIPALPVSRNGMSCSLVARGTGCATMRKFAS